MWQIFLEQNFNFAINVLAGLIFFLTAWLYFDAWKETKSGVERFKVFGFMFVGISFFARSLDLTTFISGNLTDVQSYFKSIDYLFRFLGYLLIIVGLVFDPIQPKPKLEKVPAVFFLSSLSLLSFIFPVLSSICFLLYLRRSSVGLERHLYPPSIAFVFLSFYELFFSLNNFSKTNNLFLFKYLDSFGLNWIIYTVLLAISILVLGRWVIKYLLKQFETQIFIFTMLLIISIYFLVTASFTGLLINDVKNLILNEIKSEGKVVAYAISSKHSKLISEVKYLSSSGEEVSDNDSLIKFDKNGVITFQMEDIDKKGTSITSDNLVKEVLAGKTISDIYVKDDVYASIIMARSGAPIYKDGDLIGGVIIADILDSAWVSGFKKVTGLTVSLYGGNKQSAGEDVGIIETSKEVIEKVLTKGEEFGGETKYKNSTNLSSFTPIKDINNNPVGMYYIGRPVIEVLNLMVDSLEIIFTFALVLLIVSLVPAKLIARSISRQIK